MNSTIKKYVLVVFITLLVWFWANSAMERTIAVTASIATVQTGDSDILATFDKPMPLGVKITVRGQASKIKNLQKLIAAGQENLDFIYNLQNDVKGEGETIPLDTAKWLNQTVKMKSLSLNVESADPVMIQVFVEKLVKKELDIECFDEDGLRIIPDSLKPSTVDVFVRQGWVGKARIDLSAADLEKAREDYVIKEAYVELTGDEKRYGNRVTVKLQSVELPVVSFQPGNIMIGFSKNLQGKYRIELLNESELTGTTTFKALPEAMEEYKNSPVHIIVLVLDGDEDNVGETIREVIYKFPPEYFAAGKIKLAKEPVKARFRLIKSN